MNTQQDQGHTQRRTDAKRQARQAILPLLVLALLVAFGLRVYRLGDKSIWWDEGLAAWSARQSLVEISRWTSADVHPPLYFWMLHFWRLGSGDSEYGLRFLSACMGVLTVAATYLLGREVSRGGQSDGKWAGLLAAWMVALSRFDVWWSQEARMYAMAALWAALSFWAAVRFWDSSRRRDAVLYALYTCAGLYTLYLGVSVLVIANLVWLGIVARALWTREKGWWKNALTWIIAQAAVLAVFLPWLFYALGRMPTWSSASPVKLGVFMRIYWTVLTLGVPTHVERYAWLTLPLLAVFVGGLAALGVQAGRERRTARNLALLALGLLLPAGVVYAVSLPRETFFYSPQLAPRYLILFAPAFYALLAWGITTLSAGHATWGRWLRAGLALLVLGGAIVGLATYYPERILIDDWKSLVATLRDYERPQDAVVLYTDQNWPVFSYHYDDPWHKIPHALQVTPQEAEAYLAPIWEAHEGLWLVVTPYASINDPEGHVPAWLGTRAKAVAEHRYADKVLRFYARTDERAERAHIVTPSAAPPTAVRVLGSAGFTLTGYGLPVHEVRPGDTIHLALYGEHSPGKNSTRSLRAALTARSKPSTPDGQPCPSQDAWLAGTLLPEHGYRRIRPQLDIRVPPDARPGRYTIALQAVHGITPICLGEIRIRPWRAFGASGSQAGNRAAEAEPIGLDFEDGVHLVGYTVNKERLSAGETLTLTLYWRARQPVSQRYKVFTHLLGETYHAESGGFVWAQQDNEPASGARPTSTWRSGEVIEDVYALSIPANAPAGSYAIEVGMYDPATVARLAVLDSAGQVSADHVVLASVRVE